MAEPPREEFERRVGAQARRKLKARGEVLRTVWSGIGMMGLVGWSVAAPTLLGAVLGRWLDEHHPATHSWTLALLVAGLCVGCVNAWRWVSREGRAMHRDAQTKDE